MADIFISYARKDLERAEPLAHALNSHGWEVWWDISSLRTGESFNEAIQEALSDVKTVVVLWSETSVDSPWVKAEAYFAWERNKLASIILDEGITLPVPFNTTHAESLCGWSGGTSATAYKKIITDLTAMAGAPSKEPETPPAGGKKLPKPTALRALRGKIGV